MPKNYTECSKCGNVKWVVILPDEKPICPKCLINIAYGKDKDVVFVMKGFTRDYHTTYVHDGKMRQHRPYCAFLHSMEKDEEIPYKDNLYTILDALPEGATVEISVKVGGRDKRATEDPIVWFKSHHYEILSRLPEDIQTEIKKKMEDVE